MRWGVVAASVLSAAVAGLGSEAFAARIGPEFQINTYTTRYQRTPSVASLVGGGFVVTWHSEDQDGSGYGVYGQRYRANGARKGGELRINSHTTDNQWNSSVASLHDGGFVVTWESDGQDGSGYGVFGQRFNARGKPRGGEFQANTYTSSYQGLSSVAGLAKGGFVVFWNSAQDGSASGVYGQRYNARSVRKGLEFRANTYTTKSQWGPSVAALAGGGFVVAWMSDDQDGSGYGIYAQRYGANGGKKGPEFLVNTFTTSSQRNPSVAGLTEGGFVVSWDSSGQDSDGKSIHGQRFNANGNPKGGEFQANTYEISTQDVPAVAGLSNGGFVVTWESSGQDGDKHGVYGQRFNAKGNPRRSEFRANTYTWNDEWYPAVAGLSEGTFVVTWESTGQDGSLYGIFGQRFD